MDLISLVVGFVAGVVAVVVFNMVRPEKIDKASRELREEVDALKAKVQKLQGK